MHHPFSFHLHSLDIGGSHLSVVSVATGVPCSGTTGTPDCNITSTHWQHAHTEVCQIPCIAYYAVAHTVKNNKNLPLQGGLDVALFHGLPTVYRLVTVPIFFLHF